MSEVTEALEIGGEYHGPTEQEWLELDNWIERQQALKEMEKEHDS